MHITLTQKALAGALDPIHRVVGRPVQRVVARPGAIPILLNVRLVAEAATDDMPASIRLTGTDLDREVTVSTLAEVSSSGETTVPAGLLLDIVRKLPSGAEVTLAVDDEGRQMTVSAGRSRFRLPCLPAGDFPDIKRAEPTHSFTLMSDQVRSLFGRTIFAVSTEETRFYLAGVHLHVGYDHAPSDLLTAVATDGHRLVKVEVPVPDGAKGMPAIIVPSATVNEVVRLVGKGDGEVGVRLSDSAIELTIGSTTIHSKLVDGSYPDYQRVIPLHNDHTVRIDRGSFASAVDRVSTVTADRGRAVKIELGSALIRLSMTAPDAGSATEEVDAAFDGQPFEIGVNAKYLSGMLGEMNGDRVEWSLGDPGSPTILTDPDDASRMCVLMPMRV